MGEALRPLEGFRAVSLAINVPGPTAAARLVKLGAAVTKVEPPGSDPLAVTHPDWYEELRIGQEVVTLDLKEPDGRARLDELLDAADLLLTSSRPSALSRLGLAADDVHARFPRLAYVAIVGHLAPEDDRAGHDLTYVAEQGLVAPPDLPRTLVADLGGAELAVTAAVGLLLARERDSDAAYAEVALADAAAFFAAPLRHGATGPGGPLGGGLPYYNVYRARDGWIAVAALEPHFQDRLREGLGLQELTHEALAQAFSARTPDEWEAWATAHDIPLGTVRTSGL